MEDKEKDEGFFESVGKILGYFDVMNISILGILLMIVGIAAGFEVFDAEHSARRYGSPMVGTGIASAGLVIAGAILQAAKHLRK